MTAIEINCIPFFDCIPRHVTIIAARGDAPAPDTALDHREANTLVVLEKGLSIPYTVPSFLVFTVMLRRVQLQWEDAEGEHQTFDAFMRECSLLKHSLPAEALVTYRHENTFFVEADHLFSSVNNVRPAVTNSSLLLPLCRKRSSVAPSTLASASYMRGILCLLFGGGDGLKMQTALK